MLAATATLTLASGTVACLFFGRLLENDWFGEVLLTALTVGVSFPLIWKGFEKDRMWLAAILTGAKTGAIVTAVYGVYGAIRNWHSSSWGYELSLGTLLSAIVGALIGGVLGAMAIPVFVLAERAQASTSQDRVDRALLPGALGLLFISSPWPFIVPPHRVFTVFGTGAAAGCAVLLLGFLAWRDVERIEWLTNLYRGKLKSYRVVAGPRDLSPMLGAYRDEIVTGRILFYPPPEPPPKEPYREKVPVEPVESHVLVARAPLELSDAKRPFSFRLALIGLSFALIGVLLVEGLAKV